MTAIRAPSRTGPDGMEDRDMTEDRLEKNKINSQRFNDIVVWSIQNLKLWRDFCYDTPDESIPSVHLNDLIDYCTLHGFMEIYYVVLIKISETANIGFISEMEKFIQFLQLSIDKDITLDMDRITAALGQRKQNHLEKWG